jgi:hypothetical protein
MPRLNRSAARRNSGVALCVVLRDRRVAEIMGQLSERPLWRLIVLLDYARRPDQEQNRSPLPLLMALIIIPGSTPGTRSRQAARPLAGCNLRRASKLLPASFPRDIGSLGPHKIALRAKSSAPMLSAPEGLPPATKKHA